MNQKSAAKTWVEILFARPLIGIILAIVVVGVFALCMFGIPRLTASFKEEVPYTEKLSQYTPAYADVQSVTPETLFATDGIGGEDLFCQCILTDGTTIWVMFDREFYLDNVQPILRLNQKVTFSAPVRFHGTQEVVGKVPGVFYARNNNILRVDKVDKPAS